MKALGYSKEQAPGAISPYLPDFIADNIADVDFNLLKAIGVTHIMLDLDQTLRRAYSKALEAEVIEVFRKLKTDKTFKVVAIVSNNNRNLKKYAEPIGAQIFQPYWHGNRMIRKPNSLFFKRVMDELGIKPEQAAMVGDKLRSDIIGANKVGIRTILVKPRGQDYWFDQILLSRWREHRRYQEALSARRQHLPSTAHYLKETLKEAGLPAAHVRQLQADARGSVPFIAWDGTQTIFVKLLSRRHTAADWLFKLARRIAFRRLEDELPYFSPKQSLEHEAYISSLARAAGVRTPKTLQIVDLGDYRHALATEYVDGAALDKVPKKQLTDALLQDIWQQVALLHKAGIAHRDLRAANIIVHDDKPWIIDFDFATTPATERNMVRDHLELLVSTATLVGAPSAIRNASSVLDIRNFRMLLPFLKSKYLSGSTRQVTKNQPQILTELRQDIDSLLEAHAL